MFDCFFIGQVMALIAYLMEFKGNYGPHLIIVPNAVLVNWKVSSLCDIYYCCNKHILPCFSFRSLSYIANLLFQSELHNWLPSVSCIYYVGGKDQRSKLFSQVSCANLLIFLVFKFLP